MIATFDPFQRAFLRVLEKHGIVMGSPIAHAVLRDFFATDEARDRLADLLHYGDGLPYPDIDELNCYCRRIATTTGRHDAPITPLWGETEYDPAKWGGTALRPTRCEQVAAKMLENWKMDEELL
jgi:phytoene/squalene synthetase